MTQELKILFVEDLPTDVELAKRTLTKEGIIFQSRVVDTEADFLQELKNYLPDIIISDYQMPQFNGIRALKLRLEKCSATPFILLTGSVNEEIAVECMKSGATDYIIKEHIARLPLAVKDALEKKKIILGREKAELELKESEEHFRSLYNNSTIGLYRTTPKGKIILANPSLVKMLGYTSFEELTERDLEKDGFKPSYERKQFLEQIEMNGEVRGLESAWVSKNGTTVFIHESAKAIRDANGKTLYYDGTIEDITERKKAEESLKISEHVLNETQQITKIGGWEYNVLPNQTYFSDEVFNIYGIAKEKMFSVEEGITFYHPDDRALVMESFTKAITNAEPYDLVVRFISARRENLWVRTAGKPILENGIVVKVIGYIIDITERKLNEEALKESEERFRSVTQSANDAIITADSKGIILNWNAGAEKIFGYTEKEITGKNLKVIIPQRYVEQHINGMKRIEQDGEHHVIGKTVELHGRHKNGKEFPLELSLAEWETSSGKFFTGIIRDITERKRAEEAIKESEEYYRYIVEATKAVLYHLKYRSMKYDYIDSSIEKLIGYTPEEINEIGFKNIVVKISKYHVEKVDIDLAVSERKQGHTLEWQADYQIKAKNGKLIWLTDYSVPWKDEADNLIGSIGILSDITERKNAEEEIIIAKNKAEELNSAKTNFLHNMSHELRTPLNGILGYAALLTSELTEPEHIEMTKGIYNSGKRLSDTLNFILDLTEAETGKIEVILKDISVVPPVKNIIKSFINIAAKKNLQIETIINDGNISALLDERLFNRTLNSLLDNAVKFTIKGKIGVEVGKEVNEKGSAQIYIIVKDTGVGIAPDKIDLIWDAFRQVSEGISRSHEGTGLGLTIAKKAVELMHGVILVESELGIGSTFTLKFPAGTVLPQKETEEEKPTATIPPKKQKVNTESLPLVLYVEDDLVNQTVMRLYLRNICNVETANDGVSALKLATEKKYYLVLMDINLGAGMNGMEVTKEMRKMARYADTPIIAVTAYAMASKKKEFLKGGCTHFISKPFEKKEIVDLVTSVLGK